MQIKAEKIELMNLANQEQQELVALKQSFRILKTIFLK